MKAVLEFQLPEESIEHKRALNGSLYRSEIEDFSQYLRTQTKYGKEPTLANLIKKHNLYDEQVDAIIYYLRDMLYEKCRETFNDE